MGDPFGLVWLLPLCVVLIRSQGLQAPLLEALIGHLSPESSCLFILPGCLFISLDSDACLICFLQSSASYIEDAQEEWSHYLALVS